MSLIIACALILLVYFFELTPLLYLAVLGIWGLRQQPRPSKSLQS